MIEQDSQETEGTEPETVESEQVQADETPAQEDAPETEAVQTFDADYVKALRAEAAEYRVKAKRADALAKQALNAMATADGRLIDPTDLAYTDDMTGKDGTLDAEAVRNAIDSLIETKPHLARRRPTAPVAQGARTSKPEPNLLQLIQASM